MNISRAISPPPRITEVDRERTRFRVHRYPFLSLPPTSSSAADAGESVGRRRRLCIFHNERRIRTACAYTDGAAPARNVAILGVVPWEEPPCRNTRAVLYGTPATLFPPTGKTKAEEGKVLKSLKWRIRLGVLVGWAGSVRLARCCQSSKPKW